MISGTRATARHCGYADFARQAAGLPLCGGLLRLAGAREGRLASGFVREGFPEFAAVAVPFAIDWIGRVVALDQSGRQACC